MKRCVGECARTLKLNAANFYPRYDQRGKYLGACKLCHKARITQSQRIRRLLKRELREGKLWAHENLYR